MPKPFLSGEDATMSRGDAGSTTFRRMKATAYPRSVAPIGELTQHLGMAADLISVPETARRIGLHTDTLYRLCRTGQFPPAIQIGTRWRVSVPRLERYLHGEANGVLT